MTEFANVRENELVKDEEQWGERERERERESAHKRNTAQIIHRIQSRELSERVFRALFVLS